MRGKNLILANSALLKYFEMMMLKTLASITQRRTV
jgi:hypothetical protein